MGMTNTGTELSRWSRWAACITWLAAGWVMSGCMSSFRSPEGFQHIELVPMDSAHVNVTIIWLTKKGDAPLRLVGRVISQPGVEDTTTSHVIVTLLDRDGHELRRETVNFEPRQIPQRTRPPPPVSLFRLELDPVPLGTARIEARAWDGA